MVVQAHEGEVVEVGPTARFPWNDVMHIGEGHVGTTREATMSVPAHDLAALGIARFSPGPALVHGVPDVVVDRDGHGGVTGDPLHGLDTDQPVTLELARQLALLAGLFDQGARGTWTTTK